MVFGARQNVPEVSLPLGPELRSIPRAAAGRLGFKTTPVT